MRRATASRLRRLNERRFNAFVSDETAGIGQARANVVRFQPGVALQHDLRGVAGGQHAEDMLDGESAVPDDRLAAEDGRVRRDSTEEVRFAASAGHKPPANHPTSVPISSGWFAHGDPTRTDGQTAPPSTGGAVDWFAGWTATGWGDASVVPVVRKALQLLRFPRCDSKTCGRAAASRASTPDGAVTVVGVQWFGSEALELTYKTPGGAVANELLYRHDEDRLEVVAPRSCRARRCRPRSEPGRGARASRPSATARTARRSAPSTTAAGTRSARPRAHTRPASCPHGRPWGGTSPRLPIGRMVAVR